MILKWPKRPVFLAGGIKVSSTNPSIGGGKSSIRVYKDGKLIGEVLIAKRNPLPYLRGLTRSKYFRALEVQLIKHGVTLSDVGLSQKNKHD